MRVRNCSRSTVVFTSKISKLPLPFSKPTGGQNVGTGYKSLSVRPVYPRSTAWVKRGSIVLWLQNYLPCTVRGGAEVGRRVQIKPHLWDLGPLGLAQPAAPGSGGEHCGGGAASCLQRLVKP
jgi:hypothetical protein